MLANASSSSRTLRHKTMRVRDNSCNRHLGNSTNHLRPDRRTIHQHSHKNSLSQEATITCRFRHLLILTHHCLSLILTGIKQSVSLPSRFLNCLSNKTTLPSRSHLSRLKTPSQLLTQMRQGSSAWPTSWTISGIGTVPWIEKSESLVCKINHVKSLHSFTDLKENKY